jgi:hypothetical protein
MLTCLFLLKAGTLITLKASNDFFSSHVMIKGLVDPNYIYVMLNAVDFEVVKKRSNDSSDSLPLLTEGVEFSKELS